MELRRKVKFVCASSTEIEDKVNDMLSKIRCEENAEIKNIQWKIVNDIDHHVMILYI